MRRGGRGRGRPDRARARDAHARRPRLGSRPARARARRCRSRSTRSRRPSSRTSRWPTASDSGSARCRSRVLHTPGHRPEHCAFLVDDTLVLTGDSLFVGDAARPDLAVAAREGAQDLFHSLEPAWPRCGDGVEVYPGHVAGSLCGGNMSADRSSTIGRERETNRALAYRDVQEFVLVSASVSTPRPPTTERVVALNRGPWLARPDDPSELDDPGDATVLDVRPFHEHAAGHVPARSACRSTEARSGRRPASCSIAGERVVLHARSQDEAHEAARRLWAVGILEIAGYVARSRTPTRRSRRSTWTSWSAARRSPEVQVVDVREAAERDERLHPRLDEHPVPAAAQGRLRRAASATEAGRHGLRERPARGDRRVAARSAKASTSARSPTAASPTSTATSCRSGAAAR